MKRKNLNLHEELYREKGYTWSDAVRKGKILMISGLARAIEPGKLADLVVLSDDILTCPENQIKDITPLITMVGGTIVYER